jgi:pyruvate,water dikinase
MVTSVGELPGASVPNPVHMVPSPGTRWSTVNFAEAIHGVQKPFSWSMWSLSVETSIRKAFGDIGAFTPAEVAVPADVDRRISGIFYGRAAGNIDVFRLVGDRMPGSSGDAIEEKILGTRSSGTGCPKDRTAYRRYPIVAVKLPKAAWRAAREMPKILRDNRAWWLSSVRRNPPTDLASAQRLLNESIERFLRATVGQAIVTFLSSGLLEQLESLAKRATGSPELAVQLATGYGAMEETQLIEDLSAVSAGRLELATFIDRFGFHGPDEGNLATPTWREDPSLLDAMLRGYGRSSNTDPRARERAQAARREAAEVAVLAALPAVRRPLARLLFTLAARFIPLREVGKAGFLIALDAARCAGRAAGRALEEAGAIDAADDVFYLTIDEVLDPEPRDHRHTVAERKAQHELYGTLRLPPTWTGRPEPVALEPTRDTPGTAVAEVTGIGVVGGPPITGRARVVTSLPDADLDEGDILVCATTDPSWTPLFMLVDALVIDTGGSMSHGAIVARELGVPCVINTVTGTRDIPDGATITVDGTSGTVTIRR